MFEHNRQELAAMAKPLGEYLLTSLQCLEQLTESQSRLTDELIVSQKTATQALFSQPLGAMQWVTQQQMIKSHANFFSWCNQAAQSHINMGLGLLSGSSQFAVESKRPDVIGASSKVNRLAAAADKSAVKPKTETLEVMPNTEASEASLAAKMPKATLAKLGSRKLPKAAEIDAQAWDVKPATVTKNQTKTLESTAAPAPKKPAKAAEMIAKALDVKPATVTKTSESAAAPASKKHVKAAEMSAKALDVKPAAVTKTVTKTSESAAAPASKKHVKAAEMSVKALDVKPAVVTKTVTKTLESAAAKASKKPTKAAKSSSVRGVASKSKALKTVEKNQ